MKQRNLLQLAVCSALAVIAAPAQAISFTANDWNLDINGTVNGFYTNTNCSDNSGASQWATLSACNSGNQTSSIQNGLLPGWISFVATTRQSDLDVKAHFGFAPGTSLNGTSARGAQTVGDVRNVYLSFGDKSWGTVKIGRDIGLFQQQAILADMTLLGVGGSANLNGVINTTTGLIGKGYMYTAFQPQITFSTPNYSGFQGHIGLFQPADIGPATVHGSPMIQGLGTFDIPAIGGKAWASFVSQSSKIQGGGSLSAQGFEIGAKGGAAGFEATLVGFDGKGIGDALLFVGGVSGTAATGFSTMKTQGMMGQLTYKPPGMNTKFGINFGETKNKDIAGSKNSAMALGVYHNLTKSLTLVGEYIDEKTKETGATDSNAKTLGLGAILFF